MSPAMLELRSPAAASSPQLKPHRSRNPREGQIFTAPSPSPLDQSGTRSIRDSLGDGWGSMDRNPNEGIPHSTFAPPYPFPPSAPAFGKPSPAAGLSRPRLMKVRKRVASPRVKPAVAPDSGSGPGFNPFRPGPSATDPPIWEDSGMQPLHDRIPTRRPFDHKAGTGVPENSSGPNSGSSESSDPRSASFVFGVGSVSNSKSKDIGSGDIPGPIFGFGSKEIGNSETATFAFGSGVKKPSNLSRASPEDSSGLNLGSSESVKSESADFVFGSGSISIPSTRNDRAGNEEDNAFISTSEQVGNSDSDVFVCGGAVKNSSNLGRNSSLGSNAVSFSQLPDEMRSLKLQSLGNEDGHTSSFIFRGSKNAQTEVSGNPDDSCFLTENLFTRPHQNVAFSLKKGESKGSRTRRGKSRQSALGAKQFFSREKVSQENPEIELPGDYSPMDYSPCDESFVTGQCSREASVASDEPIHFVSRCASTEGIVSATQRLGIDDGDLECREMDEDGSKDHGERNFAVESSFVVDRTSGFGSGNLEFKYENIGLDSSNRITAAEAETGSFRSNIEREGSEGGMLFTSTSSVEEHGNSNYTFAAPPSIQGPMLASKRHYRRKNRMRTGQDAYNSTPNDKVPLTSSSPKLFRAASTSVHPDPTQDLNGIPFVPQTENNNIADKNKKPEASQASVTTDEASIAAQETCEKWRFRGNQAYANGHLSKAEDYYTRGVNSVSLNETSRSCIRSLMLCYSNRAATRMSLGRMQEAISDCKMAIAIDPDFLRAQVRAANCHLALGEIKDALKHFKKCLQSENDANSNQKILIEASEGLRKAQQVADYMDQSAELLLKRTTNDATKALQIASEALSISPHSENLMEMKAESLLMLRNFEEVIQLCEETLDSAKKSSIVNDAEGQSKDADSSRYMESSHERLWRWRLISKSYFLLGKLEEAVEILEKHENVKIITDNEQTRNRSWSPDSSTSLMVTIRELLRHKAAGNEAFQAGRHSEAVEHYTAALACNTESRPFVAICFCNRAASYQALGQITDAIADCSLAIALDASYPKAISRRATLHEMIRDYGQAAKDLTRLLSLLENHLEDKDNTSATPVRSTTNSGDLKRARSRLSTMEEEAGKGTPLDLYMILGIDPSSSAADVKKAYRKAALRHHPDKAGHFLARSENVCDGLWREVADEVHIYADRLFKMIGEAYTVLSDPTKRLQYDAEEETRTSTKVHSGSSTSKTPSDNYSSRDERSADRRNWWDHGSSRQRSFESSRSGSGTKTWNFGV